MRLLLLMLLAGSAWAGADQLGGSEGGAIGPMGLRILLALVGLVLGAWAGGFLASITAHDERRWTGRGAIVGAIALALMA
jgi:hypothetical protein